LIVGKARQDNGFAVIEPKKGLMYDTVVHFVENGDVSLDRRTGQYFAYAS
jgi:hypothetical protein